LTIFCIKLLGKKPLNTANDISHFQS